MKRFKYFFLVFSLFALLLSFSVVDVWAPVFDCGDAIFLPEQCLGECLLCGVGDVGSRTGPCVGLMCEADCRDEETQEGRRNCIDDCRAIVNVENCMVACMDICEGTMI